MRRISVMTAALILLTVGAFLRPGVDPVRQQGRSLRRQFPGRAEGAGHHLRHGIRHQPAGARLQRRKRPEPLLGHGGRLHGRRENTHGASRRSAGKRAARPMPARTTGAPTCRARSIYASWKFLQRNAKVTYYAWAVTDNVEGQRLQLTNPDGSRTFAAIYRHGTRLYILEGTVPAGAPAPGLFQQSLMCLDEEGKPVRYRAFYTTGYSEAWRFPAPPPPRTGEPPPPPRESITNDRATFSM